MPRRMILIACLLAITPPCFSSAQDRAAKVRADKQRLGQNELWIYNDFAQATAEAERTGKPLFVVLRCIPCEACSQFDKQLLDDQTVVRDLLDKFVCVRIVQANALDLSLFQFDYDQSFHAFLMNADRTVYGRFGTRSERPEQDDMTIEGLRAALLAALELHGGYPQNRDALAGKQGKPVDHRKPEDLPALAGRYGADLDYEGNVVQSCIHCHQIRDAERTQLRSAGKAFPPPTLYPYPLPDAIGLRMDPNQCATIAHVAHGSAAQRAGLALGDAIASLDGQPLVSTADLQWALHNAPDSGELDVQYVRDGQARQARLPLDAGWRAACDISWRPTTWQLRAMATGGLRLVEASADERRKLGLADYALALVVMHVGQYGDHAAAKRAGFEKGDVLVAIEGDHSRRSESGLIALALQHKAGDALEIEALRNGQRIRLRLPVQ